MYTGFETKCELEAKRAIKRLLVETRRTGGNQYSESWKRNNPYYTLV